MEYFLICSDPFFRYLVNLRDGYGKSFLGR